MSTEKAWWQLPREQAGRELARTVETLATSTEQLEREERFIQYAQLYANQQIRTLRDWGGGGAMLWSGDAIMAPRWSYNVCKAGVNTIHALIGKGTPRIQIQTSGGRREDRKRAEMMTRFLDGVYHLTAYRKLARQRLLDALIFDDGYLKWSIWGSSVIAERRFPWEVLWDPMDGRDGCPIALYDGQRVPVESVLARYDLKPEQADKVRRSAVGGRVWLDEAWMLPLDEPEKNIPKKVDEDRTVCNGRRMVQCGGEVLLDTHWPRHQFPLIQHKWGRRPVGFGGQGVVEELEPYQSEIHRVLTALRANHRMGAVLRIAMQQGTQVGEISNEPASILRYKTQAPQFFVPELRTREFLGMAEEIFNKGLEVMGISRQASSGRKEPGVTAASAILELRDIQTDRFAPNVEDYDETGVEDAKMAIMLARELYEQNREMQVRAPGTDFLEEIDWSKIDLREDAFVVRPAPSGWMPTTPHGRRTMFEALYKDGHIDRLQYLEGIADGDILSTQAMELAPLRRIDRIIDDILDAGEYETPDEFIAFDLAIKRAHQSIAKAEEEDVPKKRVLLLRQWADDVARLKRRVTGGGGASAAAAEQMAADQAAAGAVVAAEGNPAANPAGMPVTPTAPGMPAGVMPGGPVQ